ncbi:N-acetylglucosamine-6-phosphate deacetylase [Rhodobacterales bacterium HKCCSP123]|nr:N-acetylglucosamine-6-phosphate deacetylase [Rhodobacterales bacterium HKCCSP123]
MSRLTGLDLLDGTGLRRNMALRVAGGRLAEVAAFDGQKGTDLSEGGARALVTPGLFDIQVNGGAGRLLGDCRTPAEVLEMAEAHWATGTAALLPTLITDGPEVTARVIDLVAAAQAEAPDALPGLHLEGPHIAVAGAHDPGRLRPMTDADLALYAEARARLGHLLITVAPEVVPPARIAELTALGIRVALGHTGCDQDLAAAAFDAGAVMATHLFNAMSGLHHRAPGLVGATLDRGAPFGLIADGVHVHPAALRVALRASPGAAVLISDAMAVAGTAADRFALAGREVLRRNGRLELADGTLAGADLTLVQAVENVARWSFAGIEEIAPMAFDAPARVLGMAPPELAEGGTTRLLVWRGGRGVARIDGDRLTPVTPG